MLKYTFSIMTTLDFAKHISAADRVNSASYRHVLHKDPEIQRDNHWSESECFARVDVQMNVSFKLAIDNSTYHINTTCAVKM